MENKKTGCVMAMLPLKFTQDIQNIINLEDVIELDLEPHITIRYGIDCDNTNPLEIINYFKNEKKFSVAVNTLSFFENEEFDVLHLKCFSPDLVYHRSVIESKFTCFENDYPNYNPHCTVAYLKCGTGKKYVVSNEPIMKKITRVKYSYYDSDGNPREKFVNLK